MASIAAPVEEPSPEQVEAAKRGDKIASVGEHLLELRNRITVATLTLVLTTVLALVFAEDVMDYLLEPGRRADPNFRPIFTELLGFFGSYIKVSLLIGLTFAMPMILYQGVMYLNPALTPGERRWTIPLILLATVSFAGGAAFAFYIAWPPALNFLLNFGQDVVDAQVTINDYINKLTRFMFWTGIVFQTPLVLMGLGFLGIINSHGLKRAWRWSIIGSFVLSAVITPSVDPVTQAAVALPLIGLYGLGILLVKLVERQRSEPEPAAPDEA